MSLDALLIAARDRIRTVLAAAPVNLIAAECEVMGGPQPPPRAGKRFFSVHPGGGWTCNSRETLDEYLGFQVTITVKAAEPPSDRVGTTRLARASTGLIAYAELVSKKLHMSYATMDAANVILNAAENPDEETFKEPAQFAGAADAVARGPEWFGTDPVEGASRFLGLSMTLTFRNARRLRPIEAT